MIDPLRNTPKWWPLDKLGWPIERIKGRPIQWAVRVLLHGSLVKTVKRVFERASYEKS